MTNCPFWWPFWIHLGCNPGWALLLPKVHLLRPPNKYLLCSLTLSSFCSRSAFTSTPREASTHSLFYTHLCPSNYRHLTVMWGLVCGSMVECDQSQPPKQVLGNTTYGCECTVGLATAKGSAGWQGKKSRALFFHAYAVTSTRCANVCSTLGNK